MVMYRGDPLASVVAQFSMTSGPFAVRRMAVARRV
jgi:hypothetical protein